MEVGSGSGAVSAGWMDTLRITCLLDEDYSVTMYGGCVALAPANPHDPRQHWLLHQAIKLKDRDAQPAFALVNRATKQAMQSPATKGFPVCLFDLSMHASHTHIYIYI